MATVTKANPIYDTTSIFYNGNKPLTLFEINYGSNVSAQTGPGKAIDRVIGIIQNYATIVISGELVSNQYMTFAVEQTNESLDWDGNGAETLVEQIEDEIIALTDLSGAGEINYTLATATVKTSFRFV